jgi:hypothetical protein
VRNAALMQLGKSKDAKYAAVLTKAIEDPDWSTRAAALNGLESMRSGEAVGAIIARMDKESGLMLTRFAETLFRLTGKPFRTTSSAWKAWWEKEGKAFQPITAVELSKLQKDDETRRLKGTRSSSASIGRTGDLHPRRLGLDERADQGRLRRQGRQDAHRGRQGRADQVHRRARSRQLVQHRDLLQRRRALARERRGAVQQVEQGRGQGLRRQARRERRHQFVRRDEGCLPDPDVDTIFVLSDGEPSVGDETDQAIIRARVKEWNLHRGIVINTIAVGGSFQILQWLADDTGGMAKKFQ